MYLVSKLATLLCLLSFTEGTAVLRYLDFKLAKTEWTWTMCVGPWRR